MTDTEKITINMGMVDLGQIDLLVNEGFYSNRTDFIRTAIRNQLSTHTEMIKQTITRREMGIGVIIYTRKELEGLRAEGNMLTIKWVGLASIGNEVTPELARATIQSLEVHGVLRASDAVKEALADRIKA